MDASLGIFWRFTISVEQLETLQPFQLRKNVSRARAGSDPEIRIKCVQLNQAENQQFGILSGAAPD